MSTRDVLSVAGAIVGSTFGFPQLGYMAGSLLGSLVDQPDGPDPGDLAAPQINAGTAMVRTYGTVRVTANPIWMSDFHAVESGGKGGGEPATLSYTVDVLYQLSDKDDIDALLRCWVNKKVEYSALATSDAATILASLTTAAWESIELRDGNPAQMPWNVMEDVLGTANCGAQRGYCTLAIKGLNCGGGKQLPLVEAEISNNVSGTLSASGAGGFIDSSEGSGYAPTLPATAAVAGDVFVLTLAVATPAFAPVFASGWGTAQVFGEADSSGNAKLWTIVRTATGTAADASTGFTINGGTAVPALWNMVLLRGQSDPAYPASFASPGDYNNFEAAGFNLDPDQISKPAGDQFVLITGLIVAESSAGANFSGTPVGYTSISEQTATVFSTWRMRLKVAYAEINGTTIDPDHIPDGNGSYGSGGFTATVFGIRYDPAGAATGLTAAPVTLSSIIDAELSRNEAIDLADWDTSDCDTILVRGYKCTGPPSESVAKVCEIFFVDLVPGNPMRFVPRGQAAVATLESDDVGLAVGNTGAVFSGLNESNDDEQSAVAGLSYPDALNNHDPGYERSDRLQPESTSGRNVSTFVGLIPSEAKGRAIAFNLLRQASRFTQDLAWSARYARLEAGDVINAYDDQGNEYELLARALTYADGVYEAKVELNDVSALVFTGDTIEVDRSAIAVVPPSGAEAVYIDGPILREADNDAGAYSAVRGTVSGTFPGAQIRRSTDNVDFSTTVATHSAAATLGTVTAALPSTYRRWRWDEYSTLTVDLGDTGQTLSSSTKAAMQADRSINLAAVGVHGRWMYFRFRTATLVSTGIYTLSGLLLGLYGTESHIAANAFGDDFVLASTAWRRLPGEVIDLGTTRYMKAVASGQIVASVTSEAFVNEGVGRLPYAPTRLTAARDGSNNITFSWLRRTRAPVRYGGTGGNYAPVFEDTEAYEVDVYADGTYATVLRTLSSSTTSVAYSAANQTTDGLTPGNTVYARVYQLSAQVGRGNYLQAAA